MTTHILWVIVYCLGGGGLHQPLRRRHHLEDRSRQEVGRDPRRLRADRHGRHPDVQRGRGDQGDAAEPARLELPAEQAQDHLRRRLLDRRQLRARPRDRAAGRAAGSRSSATAPTSASAARSSAPSARPTARSSSRSTPTSSSTPTRSASSIRRFTDDRIAAVGGWVDVRNKHDNWLTRMQVVKYWYGYFFLKNLEWGFRRVMCLSGCLTAYRRRGARRARAGARGALRCSASRSSTARIAS